MQPSWKPRAASALLVGLVALGCGSESDSDEGDPAGNQDGGAAGSGGRPFVDPGTAEWDPVPRDQVAEVCRLDPDLLDQIDATLNLQWGIVRYGRLCHEHYPGGEADVTRPQENFSATKTLGATVVGIAAHQTRDLERTGRKTGPLSDLDRVDHWLDSFTFNPEAHVAHVLGMVAYNPSLGWGEKTFTYDASGNREINRLSDVVTTAIAQDPARLGANIEEFTQRFLFQPVGMTRSTWTGGDPNRKVFGTSWASPLRDMMRLGLLLLNDGQWNGETVLSADWVYRMTHPSFEDAQKDYGYLTWLAGKNQFEACFPRSIHAEYPHGMSQATDCNGPGTSFDCSQQYDVGMWNANGANGQLIIGLEALDMVIVIKNFGQYMNIGLLAAPAQLWPIVAPAVVALDPVYQGDVEAFCRDFDANRYAPDLH